MNRRKFLAVLAVLATSISSLFDNVASACSIDSGKTVKMKVRNRKGGALYEANIDECIAPIIKSLQDAGVVTITSCCGHGRTDGYILLEDRLLIICKERGDAAYMRYMKNFDRIGEYNMQKRRGDV